jgi:hypothetical protein
MCGVRGPVSGTKKDAIALWNTRALTPETINKEMYAYLKKMRDSMRCVCGLNELGFQLGSGVECHVCAINAILKKADGGVA